MESKTLAQEKGNGTMSTDNTLTRKECKALRLLYEDGWSSGELKMMFMINKNRVTKHAKGNCSCRNVNND